MFEFAQTNLQLYGQLEVLGYDSIDRERVAATYRFLMPMFSGLYRGTEQPFISHLVGTASILASQKLPIDLVLAGLAHAVYMAGDFGFQAGTRQTVRKRRCIQAVVGIEAEAIVARYDEMPWDTSALRAYVATFESTPVLARQALALWLANTLEDFCDDGMNYCAGPKLEKMRSPEMLSTILDVCRTLESPGMFERIDGAIANLNGGMVAVDASAFMGRSALVLPPSARRKFLPRALGGLVRRLRRLAAARR